MRSSFRTALILFTLLVPLFQVHAEELPAVTANEEQLDEAYKKQIRQWFTDGEFAKLDEEANTIRMSKEKLRNGAWKLTPFYFGFDIEKDRPDELWQADKKLYKKWIIQSPNSITARVAYAKFMTGYAWEARANGFAGTVTKDGWALFAKRLAKARQILDESKAMAPCPAWWSTRMIVGRGENMSPVEFEKLFQAAKAIEPAFQEHDFQQAIYLLPRWAGKAGDWEAAAEREIARPGGLGHAGYAKVLSSVLGYGAYGFIFAESKASWPLAEKGFEELRTTYPNSKRILNDYAYVVSVKGDDKPALKRLLEEIGPDFIAARWRDSPEYFEKMKIWANKPN